MDLDFGAMTDREILVALATGMTQTQKDVMELKQSHEEEVLLCPFSPSRHANGNDLLKHVGAIDKKLDRLWIIAGAAVLVGLADLPGNLLGKLGPFLKLLFP